MSHDRSPKNATVDTDATDAIPAVAAPVLVVNDRSDQLLVLSTILEPLGQPVVTAASGTEALRRLLETDFAVMLLDVNMPGMNGFEIAEAIRRRPKSEHTPIIFVTASSQTDMDNLRGYETGAIDYVHVPVNPAILRAKVAAFVRMHRLNAEVRRQAEALKRLNGNLRDQARELAAVNQELEAFSYSVSHDLRAPLRTIDQFGAILVQDHASRLDDDGRRLVGRIRANTSRMGQLIEDLLALSHVNRAVMAVRDVDLSALAAEVVSESRQREPERKVEVVIAPGLVARADPGLARTVLENLIGNAWKYSNKQPSARIEIGKVATLRGPSTFFVRDNGAGFDMAYAEKLFTPFQRMHSAQEFAGTGIGLSIVARIIARHGGRVWAESAVDKGATFFFTLEA